jgi:hypothetical protein
VVPLLLLGYNILEEGGREFIRNVGKQEIVRYQNLVYYNPTLHVIKSELYNMVLRSPYNFYVAISRTFDNLPPQSVRNKVLSMRKALKTQKTPAQKRPNFVPNHQTTHTT